MIKINCKFCSKDIFTFPSRLGRKKYCSHSCRSKNNPPVNFVKGHKQKRGTEASMWKGGIYYHTSGYIAISSPQHPNKDIRGYVLEHRLIVEKHIGRILTKNEVVHHINGIKNDNRIENLQLFSSQSEHAREESRIKKEKLCNQST